jgi:uracil-DNA glycosylase
MLPVQEQIALLREYTAAIEKFNKNFMPGWEVPEIVFRAIQGTMALVEKERRSFTIYPDNKDIFKAFKLCDYNDCKVVIIGQDPYHNGSATGLAFGVKEGCEINPSLQVLRKALFSTNKVTGINRYEASLEYLAKQGVLLMNRTLTVRKNQPNSHARIGWSALVQFVLERLNQKDKLAWILLGNDARSLRPFINPRHFVIEYTHPISAVYREIDWNFIGFDSVNHYLTSFKIKPIQWH